MKNSFLLLPALMAIPATLLAAQAPPAAAAPRAPKPARTQAFRLTEGGSYLGIGVADIDADRAKALKLAAVRGVEVTRVSEESPAEKAGIKEGDVILQYNNHEVEGSEQFQRLVRETPPGREVKLVISRNGATQTVTASLAKRKEFALRVEPRAREQMDRLQRELENMRFRFDMPDVPSALMSWRSGMLGVEAEPLNSQLAEYFGVKQGVLVRSVVKDSAADKAGIKAGDVITKVNDATVSSPRDVTSAIRALRPKKTFPMTVVRSRQEMTVNVTIEEPASRAWWGPQMIAAPEDSMEFGLMGKPGNVFATPLIRSPRGERHF